VPRGEAGPGERGSVVLPLSCIRTGAAPFKHGGGGPRTPVAHLTIVEESGGTVRLGCVPDLRLQRLQSFLGGLYASVPELQVEVSHLRSAEQLIRLGDGALDLGLVHTAGAEGDIETTAVFQGERLAAFLPPGHRLSGKTTLTPTDLAGEVLLVASRLADPDLHDELMARLTRARYRFRQVCETSGADMRDVLFAVAEGHGIGLGPAPTAEILGELGKVVTRHALDPAPSMPDTLVAWTVSPSPELAELIAAARRLAPELHRSHAPD